MYRRILMITYDLCKPGRDYSTLYDAIKSATTWAHPVESVWLIQTTNDAAYWRNKLKTYIDPNDKLMVLGVDRHWAGYGLSTQVANWMQTHI